MFQFFVTDSLVHIFIVTCLNGVNYSCQCVYAMLNEKPVYLLTDLIQRITVIAKYF